VLVSREEGERKLWETGKNSRGKRGTYNGTLSQVWETEQMSNVLPKR